MTPVEQIKARLSIVDVVGSYVKLTKAGNSYKALCPFHNEKSPSFNVSPAREAFYCFGCNRGGDIFSFVEGIEGIEFVDALKLLAVRAGVTLKEERARDTSKRDRALAMMDIATTLYEERLKKEHAVLAYLEARGLTAETIRDFRIGFAPEEWRFVYDVLREKGYSDEEISGVGLIKPVEGKTPYDRFRGRIMFPIFDGGGQVVAFSGRVYGTQKNKDGTDVAKYINSPETELYDKSSILFGYDRAKRDMREQNFCVLVEGQMDLIMSHQAGAKNTVAVSGTALTEKHLGLIKRLTDNLIFAFDADDAGLSATVRAFQIALALGMHVRVATIPDGKDPADYIAMHPDGWGKVLESSRHIMDFYMEVLGGKGYDPREFRSEVEKKVLPLVLAMQSKIEQAHFIVEVARKLGVKEDAVWEEVKRMKQVSPMSPLPQGGPQFHESPVPLKPRRRVTEEEVLGIILWQEEHKEPAIDPTHARTLYIERLTLLGVCPLDVDDDLKRTLVIKAEHTYQHIPTLIDTMTEMLDQLELEYLREKQADLLRQIGEAESSGKKEELKQILLEYQQITPRMIAIEDRAAPKMKA
jgi:DNA primase